MTSVTEGWFVGGSQIAGTSLSAPIILSNAILLDEYTGLPFTYFAYPIMKKATLMAASRDAIGDGEVLKGSVWTTTPDGEDGAGAPDMNRAKAIADSGWYRFLRLTPTDPDWVSCGTGCWEKSVATVYVPAGNGIKVALAYNACASLGGQSSLDADFDLYLTTPPLKGCTFSPKSSTSTNSEVELIYNNCASGAGGNYTIRIRRKTGSAFTLCAAETDEPVAIAWDIRPI